MIITSHLSCGTSQVSFLCLGVCQGSGTSRSGQNTAERHLGTRGPSGSGLLKPTVSSVKDIGEGWCPIIDLSSLKGYVIPNELERRLSLSLCVLELIRQ